MSKAQPMKWDGVRQYSPCEPKDATHVFLHMPGPFPNRHIPVILKGTRKGTGCWSWNGDTEKPTLRPSIKTWTEDEMCHCWVNDGKVQFLNDCTHGLAGKTVDLLEYE